MLQANRVALREREVVSRTQDRYFSLQKTSTARAAIFVVILLVEILGAGAFCAAQQSPLLPRTHICPLLDHSKEIGLSESQIKRLQVVIAVGQEKMLESRSQAEIRLQEIRRISSDWANLDGLVIRNLVKEYYDFLAKYIIADLECMINASEILDISQLQSLTRTLTSDTLNLNLDMRIQRVVAEKEASNP
jgi:hypothetical protein